MPLPNLPDLDRTNDNYAFTFLVVAIAGLISGLIIRRQIDRLDLIAVLKTRE